MASDLLHSVISVEIGIRTAPIRIKCRANIPLRRGSYNANEDKIKVAFT